MYGWEKIAGTLTVAAGIVYIIGVVLGVVDGLSINNDGLEAFVANEKCSLMIIISGVIAAIAGYFAITAGVIKGKSSMSLFGLALMFFGIFLAVVAYRDDLSTLSWENLEIISVAMCMFIAFVAAFVCATNRRYLFADLALLVAYAVIIVYALDFKMIIFVVGMVAVIVSGILIMIPAKAADAADVAAEDQVPTYKREIVPATAATAANPPVKKEEPAKEEAAPAKEEAKPAPAKKEEPAAAPAKEEPAKAEPAKEETPAEAKKEEAAAAATAAAKEEPAPAKEEAAPAPAKEEAAAAAATAAATAAVAAVAAKEEPKEESEMDKLLRQGYETAVAAEGEDKVNEMSDYEIMAVIKEKDPELYAKLSALTGIIVEEPKEESEMTKLLRQGYEETVANVGEERAEEMDDYEIMAVISVVDPPLYQKLSILTGIVVATTVAEEAVEASADENMLSDEDLGLIPDTPTGLVRRACWNKGLRCRKDYGSYYIPFAFVKSKVAVYVDIGTPDNRNDEALRDQGWIVLHFKESDITDGAKEAEVINDAVKENTRALKKAKAKSKKKR